MFSNGRLLMISSLPHRIVRDFHILISLHLHILMCTFVSNDSSSLHVFQQIVFVLLNGSILHRISYCSLILFPSLLRKDHTSVSSPLRRLPQWVNLFTSFWSNPWEPTQQVLRSLCLFLSARHCSFSLLSYSSCDSQWRPSSPIHNFMLPNLALAH